MLGLDGLLYGEIPANGSCGLWFVAESRQTDRASKNHLRKATLSQATVFRGASGSTTAAWVRDRLGFRGGLQRLELLRPMEVNRKEQSSCDSDVCMRNDGTNPCRITKRVLGRHAQDGTSCLNRMSSAGNSQPFEEATRPRPKSWLTSSKKSLTAAAANGRLAAVTAPGGPGPGACRAVGCQARADRELRSQSRE